MNRLYYILLFILISYSNSFGQVDSVMIKSIEHEEDSIRNSIFREKYFSVLLGYNYWTQHFIELGVAYNEIGRVGFEPISTAIFMSSEVKIDKKLLIAPKIGVWAGGGSGAIAMGLNFLYYTNFEKSSLRFRPEIGFGIMRFKIVYGYNIPLTNKKFEGINTHNLSFAYLIGIKKTKTIFELNKKNAL